jgi:hypothetical protein
MATVVTKPQGRIEVGHAVYNGQRVPVTISLEWDRFLDTLTRALNGGLAGFTGAQGQAGAAVALSSDEGGEVEFVPGPPGPKGDRGEPGPALWMLEDPQETEVFWKV